MAREHVRRAAWIGLLDSERLTRYYAALAVRLERRRLRWTAFVVIGSTAAVASLMAESPDTFLTLLLVAIVAANIWTSCFDHSRHSVIASVASDNCAKLKTEWKNLWLKIDDVDEDEALRTIADLEERLTEATDRVPQWLADSEEINEKCTEDADKAIEHEFQQA